jgi:hypothetical protein
VTCEGDYYHLALLNLLPSQNPRSPGTSPLGLTSLKRKNLPIKVTVGGIGSVTLVGLFSSIHYPNYKLCDNRCLCRGRVAPCHKCNCFLAHSFPFILSFIYFDLLFLCFKGIVEGHCLGLMTRGDSIIHKHFTKMRRLARDKTPFLLAMPPRATTLVW